MIARSNMAIGECHADAHYAAQIPDGTGAKVERLLKKTAFSTKLTGRTPYEPLRSLQGANKFGIRLQVHTTEVLNEIKDNILIWID